MPTGCPVSQTTGPSGLPLVMTFVAAVVGAVVGAPLDGVDAGADVDVGVGAGPDDPEGVLVGAVVVGVAADVRCAGAPARGDASLVLAARPGAVELASMKAATAAAITTTAAMAATAMRRRLRLLSPVDLMSAHLRSRLGAHGMPPQSRARRQTRAASGTADAQ